MIKLEYIVHDVSETIKLGRIIGENCNSGDIICLIGELGTGKTHLVKGIAEGLGINDIITSPTFTIVNEYKGRLPLYHFDVYRVNDPDEIEAIGFDEYIFGSGICVIEWANYIKSLIPKEHMKIEIKKMPDSDVNCRKIDIIYNGKRYDYTREIKL